MTDALVILGANGQVGRSLLAAAEAAGRPVRAFDRQACDVTDPEAVKRAVAGARFVANCAAYTAVDKAESDEEAAVRLNGEAPGHMARACARTGAVLIHLSTDYVFDGTGERPWREDDATRPLGVYGRSKLRGEEEVRDALPRHVILRTAWVFSAHGANFVRTMRRLGETRPEIKVVADQHGGPTAAADIAEALLAVMVAIEAGSEAFGTYHFSGAPPTTWHGFAQAVLADRPEVQVNPIPTSAYPTPARRPANSVLDCARISEAFGIPQPDWRESLRRVLAELDL